MIYEHMSRHLQIYALLCHVRTPMCVTFLDTGSALSRIEKHGKPFSAAGKSYQCRFCPIPPTVEKYIKINLFVEALTPSDAVAAITFGLFGLAWQTNRLQIRIQWECLYLLATIPEERAKSRLIDTWFLSDFDTYCLIFSQGRIRYSLALAAIRTCEGVKVSSGNEINIDNDANRYPDSIRMMIMSSSSSRRTDVGHARWIRFTTAGVGVITWLW